MAEIFCIADIVMYLRVISIVVPTRPSLPPHHNLFYTLQQILDAQYLFQLLIFRKIIGSRCTENSLVFRNNVQNKPVDTLKVWFRYRVVPQYFDIDAIWPGSSYWLGKFVATWVLRTSCIFVVEHVVLQIAEHSHLVQLSPSNRLPAAVCGRVRRTGMEQRGDSRVGDGNRFPCALRRVPPDPDHRGHAQQATCFSERAVASADQGGAVGGGKVGRGEILSLGGDEHERTDIVDEGGREEPLGRDAQSSHQAPEARAAHLKQMHEITCWD